MFLLPVSQVAVQLRPPNGHDEVRHAENPAADPWWRVDAVRRLAPLCTEEIDWLELPYADVDAALLAVRRRLVGDRLLAEVRCPECASLGDIELSIAQYLAANVPEKVRSLEADPDGWLRVRRTRFRIPTCRDVLEEVSQRGVGLATATSLSRRCSPSVSASALAKVSALLDRVAPALGGIVEGICPDCGGRVRAWFDPGAFVLTELRGRAASVFEETHLVASAYGWTEEAILALPASRRSVYAAYIARERARA